jgi:hypothetical protein
MVKITGNEPITALQNNGLPRYKDVFENGDYCIGLTIRQHFAAMAMQGMISVDDNKYDMKKTAKYAVEAADAIINALNQPQP